MVGLGRGSLPITQELLIAENAENGSRERGEELSGSSREAEKDR
jgi:hypothetical protein